MDRLIFWGGAVGVLLYSVFLCGIVLLFSDSLRAAAAGRRMKRRLKRMEKPVNRRLKIALYLEKLYTSATGKDTEGERILYVLLSFTLLIFAVALRSFYFITALLIATICASLPLLLLTMRVQGQRTKSSKEGISMLTELYRQYRLRDKNIQEAMEAAVANSSSFPISSRHLYRFLIRLRSSSGSEEIKNASENFSFAMGTVWGRMLSNCIRSSAEKGLDVSEGLSDIIAQLKVAEQRAQERRRMNSESMRMTLFLVPVLYVGSTFMAVRYMEMDLKQFLYNQFFTPEGFMFFLVMLFMFFFNVIILRLVSETKLDF